MEVRSKKVGMMLEFNVMIFADSYYSGVLLNILIRIFSIEQVSSSVRIGEENRIQLPVFSEVPRVCRLFSSHFLACSFPSPYQKDFSLMPGSYTFVQSALKSMNEGQDQIIVNLIDVATKELVFSWLIELHTLLPKVLSV